MGIDLLNRDFGFNRTNTSNRVVVAKSGVDFLIILVSRNFLASHTDLL
jgi:hypothetical protein